MELTTHQTSPPTRHLRRLLLSAIIVPLALMLVITGLLVWQITRLLTAAAWVEHSDRVLAQANEVQRETLDMQNGVRGFRITGDEEFLEPYTRGLQIIHGESTELSDLVSDDPVQQRLVGEMAALRGWWMDCAREAVDARRAGRETPRSRTLEANKLMDQIRQRFRTFVDNGERLRDQRSKAVRRATRNTLGFVALAGALGGGLLAGLAQRNFLEIARIYNAALRRAQELNLTLEQRVAERTREAEARANQLREVNEELEEFAHSVSHDLRAPVRHIAGFTELLRRSVGPTLSAEDTAHLETIANTAGLARRMIDDLLAFSRVNRAELRWTTVNLNELVDDVRRELQPDTAGRQIEWVIDQAIPLVRGDRAMLKLVVQNLLSNAVKFTARREPAPARIEIGISREPAPSPTPKDFAVLFVRDNGAGFEMEYAGKLFGVFQRLHREDEFEGTGIGLANVRRIIARHGGQVWAQGAVGQGATFFFTLPTTVIREATS
jgi:signal transduction histidine kinase